MNTCSTPPVFILLHPQMGENIGAVARAMSNFGASDLRIVAPRDGWPNDAAIAMAAHGADIISKALVVPSLKDALWDITTLYATTPRVDVLNKPVYAPREAMAHMQSMLVGTGKTALLFGPERAGLSNEDIVLADAIISIPVHPENPSLNLGQAAVVLAYEWFMVSNQKTIPECTTEVAGSKAELEGLFTHAKTLMDAVNYFRESGKTKLMWQHLRSIWTRAELTSQEIRTLRGMIRAILRQLQQ